MPQQDSWKKTVAQLRAVAKAPITVGSKTFLPPAAFVLGPSFWRRYGCYLNCGACCTDFSLDYLPDEMERLRTLYPHAAEKASKRFVCVNGIDIPIWSIIQQEAPELYGRRPCTYLDVQTGACTIHEHNPFSCQVELIKFRIVKDRGYLLKAPYGRAWNMVRFTDGVKGDLPCDFGEFSEEQFWHNDMPVLQRMDAWAKHLGIETHLETIMQALRACVEAKELRTFAIENGGKK